MNASGGLFALTEQCCRAVHRVQPGGHAPTKLATRVQVRDMVQDFYAAQYTQALERLARLTPQLRLDLYLSSHVSALTKVRLLTAACVSHLLSWVELPSVFDFSGRQGF